MLSQLRRHLRHFVNMLVAPIEVCLMDRVGVVMGSACRGRDEAEAECLWGEGRLRRSTRLGAQGCIFNNQYQSTAGPCFKCYQKGGNSWEIPSLISVKNPNTYRHSLRSRSYDLAISTDKRNELELKTGTWGFTACC